MSDSDHRQHSIGNGEAAVLSLCYLQKILMIESTDGERISLLRTKAKATQAVAALV